MPDIVNRLIDQYVDQPTSQRGQNVHSGIVRQRPRKCNVLQTPLQSRSLKDPNHDRQESLATDFPKVNKLLVLDFAEYDQIDFEFGSAVQCRG